MAADSRSGKGAGKRGSRRGSARKKTAVKQTGRVSAAPGGKASAKPDKQRAATKQTAKSKPTKDTAGKTASTKRGVITTGKEAKVAGRARSMAARFKASILPPLPPPLTAPPKKLSRSPVRRAVCAVTAAQKGAAPGCAAVSEADLREKMRLASAYIDSWLNRRLVFAPEVTAPEDAWAQIWLWLKRAAHIEDGRILSLDLFEALYADEMTKSR